MNPVLIVLPVLLLLMFGLGLSFRIRDFAALIRRPKAVWIGLGAQIVLLPLLALLLGVLFRPEPYLLVGLMLIACSPGGSSSNIFTFIAKGDVPLSVLLTLLSSIITVFTVPSLLAAVLNHSGLAGAGGIHLPVGRLLVQNVVLVLLPIALGMLLRHFRPGLAAGMQQGLDKVALPALLLLIGIFFAVHRQTIIENFATLLPLVTGLIAAAMSAGALLAKRNGLPEAQKRTIVIEVGMQNSAQAIAIAGSPFVLNDSAFAVPAIIYALMMNVLLLPYVLHLRRKQPPHP